MGIRVTVTCDRCAAARAEASHDSPTVDDAVRATNRALARGGWISDRGALVCAACALAPAQASR